MGSNGLIHGHSKVPKANYTSVVTPAITDDASLGYGVGSNWVDLATDTVYECTDSTIGAAKWAKLGSTSIPDVVAAAALTDLALVIGDGGAKGVKSALWSCADTTNALSLAGLEMKFNPASGFGFTITQAIKAAGTPAPILTLTGAAHTTATTTAELTDVYLNLARTVQWATGAVATQRSIRIEPPTLAFVGASTVDSATTLYLGGAPRAGANATITAGNALRIALAVGLTDRAIVVTEDNVVRTAAMIRLTRSALATGLGIKFNHGGVAADIGLTARTSEPTTFHDGGLWYNTTADFLRFYDGVATRDVAFLNKAQAWTAGQQDTQLVLDMTGANTNYTSTDRNQFYGVLSIATTALQIPTGIAAGQYWSIDIQQIAAGSCALTFVASYDWGDLGAPDFTALPAGARAQICCRVLPDGATISSECSLNSVVTPGADNYLMRYHGTAKGQPSSIACSDAGALSITGNLELNPTTDIATVGGNGIVTGAAGAAGHLRKFRLLITGLADNTQVTAEVTTNLYNSETIATENVDTDAPTGGTRFDISADGLSLTVKGMTNTALAMLSCEIIGTITGGAVYVGRATVVGGKLVLTFNDSGVGTALDLSDVAVGETLSADIFYVTSD